VTDIQRLVLQLAWRFPGVHLLGPRLPVILLYHGVSSDGGGGLTASAFERHIRVLRRHFEFVDPRDVNRSRRRTDRLRIALTFDDGFRNNATVVAPILRQYDLPALFFVSSRHATPGRYLWFSYLRALEQFYPDDHLVFRNVRLDLSAAERSRSIERLSRMLLAMTPHPAAMYAAIDDELPRLESFVDGRQIDDCYAGMTSDQIVELAADPRFSIGGHTVDHPLLTRCAPSEARRQVHDNAIWIESLTGRRCDAFAYPGGDYNDAIVRVCQSAGIRHGYAVARHRGRSSPLELDRIGIYSASTEALGFKAQWGPLLRAWRVPIG